MVKLRAVVHIGSVKTGTTAFAAACTQAERKGAMPAGLLYPVGALWFDNEQVVVKHHQANAPARAPQAAIKAREAGKASVDEFERAVAGVSAAARDRAVDGAATVLLVAENLSHQTRPEDLTRILGEHFDSIDYVLVARRQQRAVGSMIVHGVKDIGKPGLRQLDVAAFLASTVQARKFDYARILDVWQHDGATLHIVPFDESAPGSTAQTDAVFDRVGLPRLPAGKRTSTRHTHSSFSADALHELARIKRRYSSLRWIPGADKRYRAAFNAAWVRHNSDARTGTIQPWRLSAADERAVVSAYGESNRRLRELLGTEAGSPDWREWFAAVGVDVAASTPEGDRS